MTKKKSLVEQAAALLGGDANEAVSTGGGATGATKGPEPVAAQGGGPHQNRPQDKKQGDLSMNKPQNPAGTPVQETDPKNNTSPTGDNSERNRASIAMHSVKEDVDAMFAGQEVSEEFKAKATTIFEAAVNVRVDAAKQALEEQTSAQIEEAVQLVQEDLEGKINEYLDYVVEQWLEQNAIAVESGLRADVAESFMKGLHELFTTHHITVPEDQVDVAEELATENDQLKQTLNAAIEENIELKKQVDSAERAKIVESVTTGLVETQKTKLSTLFEGVEFTDADEFKAKLATIKDGYLAQGSSAVKNKGIQNLLEQVDESVAGDKAADPITDPAVKVYVDAISRSVTRK